MRAPALARRVRFEPMCLAFILLVAAVLRLAGIDQIPPGLYHDEAQNGLDALRVVQAHQLPIFFEANGGREPLFIYLQALSLFLFGPSAWALRLVAAAVGILTVAAFFLLVRELDAPGFSASSIALIAAAGLATSYWHLHFSRVGLRAILLPLLACLTFYFYFRARRTGRALDDLLAGLFLGLSFYSYISARLLPLVFLVLFVLDVRRRHVTARQILLLAATAVIVAAPLGIYFLLRPAAFFSRASDVAITASSGSVLDSLGLNLLRVAGMFFVRGDIEWRHGLSLRPVLDVFSAALFLVGMVVSVWRRREWPAALFMGVWLVVMLVPTILSEQAPDTLRSIGAVAAVYWFVALGWTAIGEFMSSRMRWSVSAWTLAGVAGLIIVSGAFTARDYFLVWANDPHAYADFNGERTDLAREIASGPPTANVVLPLDWFASPTVTFLLQPRLSEIHSSLDLTAAGRQELAGQRATVFLAKGEEDTRGFVLIRSNQLIFLPPAPFVPTGSPQPWRDRIGRVWGSRFDVAVLPSSDPAPVIQTAADFEQQIDLVGYALDGRVLHDGGAEPLTLYWRLPHRVPKDYKLFVHILDAQQNVVGGVDTYPLQGLTPYLDFKNVTAPDYYALPVKTGLATGRYQIELGLYDPLSLERVPVSENGTTADRILFGSLKVPPAPTTATPATPLDLRLGDAVRLLGYSPASLQIQPGASFRFTLFWQALRGLDRDSAVFVHLTDANGRIVAQADHDPVNGSYPTSLWDAGERVADPVEMALPVDLAAGQYQLQFGMYDRTSGARLPVFDASGARLPDDAITIPVTISP